MKPDNQILPVAKQYQWLPVPVLVHQYIFDTVLPVILLFQGVFHVLFSEPAYLQFVSRDPLVMHPMCRSDLKVEGKVYNNPLRGIGTHRQMFVQADLQAFYMSYPKRGNPYLHLKE